MKPSLIAALFAATGLVPVCALAQQVPAPDQPGGEPKATEVQQIVVTAQRREERLEDVPIAITAVSNKRLKDAVIDTVQDLNLVTPGLNLYVFGAFTEPTIRGIGSGLTGGGADANVAIYIDGVYQPSEQANNFQFNNVQSVQILKGPQGTLFGRNATGGAILVQTLDPSFQPRADVLASYGSFNDIKLSGYFSGPISSTLAGDLAVYYQHDDGYVHNVFLGTNTSASFARAVRAKLMWVPDDSTSVTLEANYSNSGNSAPFANVNHPFNLYSLSYELAQAGIVMPTNPYDVSLIQNPALSNESYGGSLHFKTKLAGGTLTDILSVEEIHPYISVDTTNTPLAIGNAFILDPETTVTEELDYASPQMGIFSFVAGGYLYYDNTGLRLTVSDGIPNAPDFVEIQGYEKTKAVAIFADTNIDLTSQLRLILGGRFSVENKLANAGLVGTPGVASTFFCIVCNQSTTWDKFTPRAIIQYHPDQTNMLYFSFSQGFKSGVYNIQGLSSTPVNPESVNAFEVGYKHDREGLSFDTAAYYYDYSNIQVETALLENGTPVPVFENAAKARIYGYEAEFNDRIDENWLVNVGFEWTHARYTSFPAAEVYTPNPLTTKGDQGGTVCSPVGVGCYFSGQTLGFENVAGNELERTPEYSVDMGLTYDHPLPVGSVEFNVSAAWKSHYYFDPANQFGQPAFWLVNAKLSWISPNQRYVISLWGKNITNSLWYIWGAEQAVGAQTDVAPPASGGVMFEARF